MAWGDSKAEEEFIRFSLKNGALRFGRFQLKSGRESSCFFNTGCFSDGAALSRLGKFYADTVVRAGLRFDMIFGPAYKGIPLAVATACALYQRDGRVVPVCFDRKEVKDHGEGGHLMGTLPAGRVLIVDDVLTSGGSVRQAVALLREAGAEPAALAIAVDRGETGASGCPAVEDMRGLGLEVVSITTLAALQSCREQTVGAGGSR